MFGARPDWSGISPSNLRWSFTDSPTRCGEMQLSASKVCSEIFVPSSDHVNPKYAESKHSMPLIFHLMGTMFWMTWGILKQEPTCVNRNKWPIQRPQTKPAPPKKKKQKTKKNSPSVDSHLTWKLQDEGRSSLTMLETCLSVTPLLRYKQCNDNQLSNPRALMITFASLSRHVLESRDSTAACLHHRPGRERRESAKSVRRYFNPPPECYRLHGFLCPRSIQYHQSRPRDLSSSSKICLVPKIEG